MFNNPICTSIFVDADDTLWHDNKYFRTLKFELMRVCSLTGENEEKIIQIFNENLKGCGLGEKEFAKAIKMTALCIKISIENMEILENAIERFLCHDIEVLDYAEDALARMWKYRLFLLTKGCVREQNEKLRRSQLSEYFNEVIIVERKDPLYFEALIKQKKLNETEIIVIGNSIRHDILPAVKIGAAAIWLNHPNNEHGRNESLPKEACEVSSWAPLVKALEAGQENA